MRTKSKLRRLFAALEMNTATVTSTPSEKWYLQLPPSCVNKSAKSVRKGKGPEWIEISSFNFGMGAYGKNVSVSEVTIRKTGDLHDCNIFFSTLAKTTHDEIILEAVKAPMNEVSQQLILKSVMISGFSMSWAGAKFVESLSLNFIEFRRTITELDDFVERLSRRREKADKFVEETIVGDKESHFASLPSEHVYIIFSYLPKEDLVNVSSTCKRFFKIASDPRLLVIKHHLTRYASHTKKSQYVLSDITK